MTSFVSLMYHNVCSSRDANGEWPGFGMLSPSVTGYFVDRETFERHCRLIAETNRLITDTQLGVSQEIDPGGESPQPFVQITFDDGWRGTIDEAGPILDTHRLRATLFVTTDLIGHPMFADRHQLSSCSDTFEIGAHGRSHRLLAHLSTDEIRDELSTSKVVLEDILGSEVDSMAFPGGSYDERVIQVATELGYRRLYTSDVGINERLTEPTMVRRVPIKSGLADSDFRRFLAGNFHRERFRQTCLSGLKRILRRRGYATLRSAFLGEESDHLEMTDLVTFTELQMSCPVAEESLR